MSSKKGNLSLEINKYLDAICNANSITQRNYLVKHLVIELNKAIQFFRCRDLEPLNRLSRNLGNDLKNMHIDKLSTLKLSDEMRENLYQLFFSNMYEEDKYAVLKRAFLYQDE